MNSSGKPRLILDLRCVNQHLRSCKFKYEDVRTAADLFHKGDWFLLVDISTSFGEILYANVSLLRNRKFDLTSQSGWITLYYQLCCELDFLFARTCAAIAVTGVCTLVFEHLLGTFGSKSLKK